MMRRFVALLIRGYRYALSPLLPPSCRFHPSCSEFAEQALAEHGLWRGGWYSVGRICRCGPWHRGGFDPVPPAASRAVHSHRSS